MSVFRRKQAKREATKARLQAAIKTDRRETGDPRGQTTRSAVKTG